MAEFTPDERIVANALLKAHQSAMLDVPKGLVGELTAALDLPAIRAAERAEVRAELEAHYLSAVVCDPERHQDSPQCSCSLVTLGWHPSIGAAVRAWLDHAVPLSGDPGVCRRCGHASESCCRSGRCPR